MAETDRPSLGADLKLYILPAGQPGELEAARALLREYESDLGVSLCFQGFQAELEDFPGAYGPPAGCFILARLGGEPAGCIALRPLEPGVCEMKRLFVKPRARGRGLGARLVTRLLEQAGRLGYQRMRLDTLERLHSARKLYHAFGFEPCEPYGDHALPGTLYYERALYSPFNIPVMP